MNLTNQSKNWVFQVLLTTPWFKCQNFAEANTPIYTTIYRSRRFKFKLIYLSDAASFAWPLALSMFFPTRSCPSFTRCLAPAKKTRFFIYFVKPCYSSSVASLTGMGQRSTITSRLKRSCSEMSFTPYGQSNITRINVLSTNNHKPTLSACPFTGPSSWPIYQTFHFLQLARSVSSYHMLSPFLC